jgi:hypothetical protein
MRSIARSCIAAMLAALMAFPGFAANEKPLGLVLQAESAQISNAKVAIGTTVYPGDKVETDAGGKLRLRMGTSQLYLLASSSATLGQRNDSLFAEVSRGTVGFSSNGADQLELEVPQGVIRASNGQPAYGQVTIVSPQEIIVSAFHGSLVLDNDGELHTIPQGKSYRVTMDLEPAAVPVPAAAAYRDNADNTPAKRRRRKLAFILLFGGIGAAVSYGVWSVLSESSSAPN